MNYDLSEVLEKLDTLQNKDVQLICFNHYKRSSSTYQCSRVKYKPESEFNRAVKEIADKYVKEVKAFDNIEEYTGQCMPETIYHLDPQLYFKDDYDHLLMQIANPEVIGGFPDEQNYNALLIGGVIEIHETAIPVKLISIHKPVSVLRKSIWEKNAFVFKELKILNLPHDFEVLILGSDDLYLMNQEGEKLFNLERSFKIQGRKVVNDLLGMDFISDCEIFEKYAMSGRCPRRLAAYNEKIAQKLANNSDFRTKVSKKFGIKLDPERKLCADSKEGVEKMIDILCGRATTDFFDEDNPVQVDHKKAWNLRT